MTINSYTETHTPPDTYYSKIKGNEIKNKNEFTKVLQSVRLFTIHI